MTSKVRKKIVKLKRDVRKRHINEVADGMGNQIRFKCDLCDKSHRQINYNLRDVTTCCECGKVCKTAAGLKRHIKIHDKSVAEPLARAVHVCRTCAKECKSLAGLKSHIRAAHQ